MHDLKWSHSEKKAAREIFEAALQKELAGIISEFKTKAAAIQTADDLWELVESAEEKRHEINEIYDFRYSRLIFVFSHLLRKGVIQESDLCKLGEEKAALVANIARL